MKKKNNIMFLLIILFVGIGFAYLSTTLSINGRGLFGKSDWKIYFDNIKTYEGEDFITTAPSTSGDTTTELNFEVNLPKPGDSYKFFVDVVNDGDLDAMINVITMSNINSDYAIYKVTYYDLVELEEKNLLKSNSRDTLLVEVSYRTDIELSTLTSDKDPIDITISLEYVQADKNAKEREYQVAAELIDGLYFNGLMKKLAGNLEHTLDDSDCFSGYTSDGLLYSFNFNQCVLRKEDFLTFSYREKEFCFSNVEEDTIRYFALDFDNNINSIVRLNSIPEEFINDVYDVSSNNSMFPIYMWYDNYDNNIKLYSDCPGKIFFNKNSRLIFYGLKSLTYIDMDSFNVTNIVDGDSMFNESNILSLDLSPYYFKSIIGICDFTGNSLVYNKRFNVNNELHNCPI